MVSHYQSQWLVNAAAFSKDLNVFENILTTRMSCIALLVYKLLPILATRFKTILDIKHNDAALPYYSSCKECWSQLPTKNWRSHKAGWEPRYINLNQRVSRSYFSCFFNEQGFNALASLPRVLILGIERKSLNHQCKSPTRQITDPLCPLYWYGHQRVVWSTNPSWSGLIFSCRMSEVITNQHGL